MERDVKTVENWKETSDKFAIFIKRHNHQLSTTNGNVHDLLENAFVGCYYK